LDFWFQFGLQDSCDGPREKLKGQDSYGYYEKIKNHINFEKNTDRIDIVETRKGNAKDNHCYSRKNYDFPPQLSSHLQYLPKLSICLIDIQI
jgi:hypothetical protein